MAQQLPLDELSTVIARIQGLLLTEEKVTTPVRPLAQAAKESVPGTIGAGVSLLDARGRRTSSGYTDGFVNRADATQYECGEGPCYDESSMALLQLFAAPAATLLAHIQASEAPRRMTEGLQASLYSRDLVNRALGVLMERFGISHEAALQRLMKIARDENSALQHVSERLLAGTLPSGSQETPWALIRTNRNNCAGSGLPSRRRISRCPNCG